MQHSLHTLKKLLSDMWLGSSGYVNFQRKTSIESGSYWSQVWLTRSITKARAREELLSRSAMEQDAQSSEILSMLEEAGVVIPLVIEDGGYKGVHMFLMPVGAELLSALDSRDGQFVSEEELDELLAVAHQKVYATFLGETVSRVREVEGTETLGAKNSVFCLFLLLNGAISRDTALILHKQANKEYVLHSDIVRYLNRLSQDQYPLSFTQKKAKLSKVFKDGDLSDFFRRIKKMRDAFGDSLQIESKEFFYFNVQRSDGEINRDTLRRIVRVLLKGLGEQSVAGENVSESVLASVNEYWINSPVERSHRSILFAGAPPLDYYSVLEHIIDEEIEDQD